MTLLVAASDGQRVWMAADAVVNGGDVGQREREYVSLSLRGAGWRVLPVTPTSCARSGIGAVERSPTE
jgi:hypothetical protein